MDAHITLADWRKMELEERALVVAHRRIHIANENLQADAEIRQARRQARRPGK